MRNLSINQGVSIIRDCSSGSNATTVLCMDEKSTFYRKYACGEDGEKLFQQIEWIRSNRKLLALPEIVRYNKNDELCFYDMAYNNYSIGMFEYSHSMPVNKAWAVLLDVIEQLEASIYRCEERKTNPSEIHAYYENKVKRNIELILNCELLKKLQRYESLEINGEKYKNLSYYVTLFSEKSLQCIFRDDPCSVIHGDLTLENIICMRSDSGEDSFYLIDPNTGNIHDSKYLDYAKLLQSLHGEYEFIKSTEDINVCRDSIHFKYTKSVIYRELYALYQEYLQDRFDETEIKSIYFHEIVHWLRLVPYQIKNNRDRAIAVYARMLILLDELYNKYGDKT